MAAKTFKKQIFPLGKHLVSDSKGKRRENAQSQSSSI